MLLQEMKWPEVAALSKDMPVIIPVAALEQHGKHMPVFTDSMLLGEIMRRSQERLAKTALFAPLMWLGNSDHHLDFSGTMSAAPRTYLNLLNDMCENFLMHGFKRIIFVNGHGGNHVPGQQAIFELRQRHRERSDLLLLFATYWLLGGKPHEVNRDIVQDRVGHACELETSMMLRIAPHLVGDYKNLPPIDFRMPFEPAAHGWITKDRSTPGYIGDPQHATAEKGETCFSVFGNDVVQLIERVAAWKGGSWIA